MKHKSTCDVAKVYGSRWFADKPTPSYKFNPKENVVLQKLHTNFGNIFGEWSIVGEWVCYVVF